MSHYYLYRHIRTDINVPFYIGIGTKKDALTETRSYPRAFKTSQSKRSSHWISVFKKCQHNIETEILFESESMDEIKIKEKEFISLHGRADLGLGPLVNHTDGGDGVLAVGPEVRLKMRLSHLGKPAPNLGHKHTPEARKKMSLAHKGIPSGRKGCKMPESAVLKMRIALTGKKHSAETRAKMSMSRKGKQYRGVGFKLSDEVKRKISEAHKGKVFSESHRNAIKAAAANRKSPPPFSEEHRMRIGIQSRKTIRTSEWCKNISKGQKGRVGAMKGKKHPEDVKRKMSMAAIGKPKSIEHTLKMRISKLSKNKDKNIDKINILTRQLINTNVTA